MIENPKYYIVEASALPEVFLKVAEAKRLLSVGEAATVNEAAKMTGISRSAFYKYRDTIQPFQSAAATRMITFRLLLRDEYGILSDALALFAMHCANVRTINSVVPANDTAVVTICADVTHLNVSLEEFIKQLKACSGVLRADFLVD